MNPAMIPGRGKKTLPTVRRRANQNRNALREIRKYQKTVHLLIGRAPFERLVREIASDIKTGLRFRKDSIRALQHAAENFLQEKLAATAKVTAHSKRKTITDKDLKLVMDLTEK